MALALGWLCSNNAGDGFVGRPCSCLGSAANTRDTIRSQSPSARSAESQPVSHYDRKLFCPDLRCPAEVLLSLLSCSFLNPPTSEIKGLIPLVSSTQRAGRLKELKIKHSLKFFFLHSFPAKLSSATSHIQLKHWAKNRQ